MPSGRVSGWQLSTRAPRERSLLTADDCFAPPEYFDLAVTPENVTYCNSQADTFLQAAERISVDPAHCIGFEDGEFVLAALASAKMGAVDVWHLPGYPVGVSLKESAAFRRVNHLLLRGIGHEASPVERLKRPAVATAATEAREQADGRVSRV